MYEEGEIGVVLEGLTNDNAVEKNGIVMATAMYNKQKIGVVLVGLNKAVEKISVSKIWKEGRLRGFR